MKQERKKIMGISVKENWMLIMFTFQESCIDRRA